MKTNSIACFEHFLQYDVLLLFILYFKYGNSTVCASEPFEQEHFLNNFLIRISKTQNVRHIPDDACILKKLAISLLYQNKRNSNGM